VARIERFEDIEGWKAARLLTRMVYDVAGEGRFVKEGRLRDQITGAAISVMANIAEGFGSDTNAQFIAFLGYARRSAVEVQSLLYVALDRQYISGSVRRHLQTSREGGQSRRRLRPLLAYTSRPAVWNKAQVWLRTPGRGYSTRPASRQIKSETLSHVLDAQHRTPNPER